jgi:hypothetical protein
MSVLLGKTGAAVSPKDSWQQRLGATAAQMGAQEQTRRYLAELLGASGKEESTSKSDSKSSESKDEGSELEAEQINTLSNLGLGSLLADYFSVNLPKTGR